MNGWVGLGVVVIGQMKMFGELLGRPKCWKQDLAICCLMVEE